MSKVITLEFDDEDMAHAFVANLLDGGGEESCMVDFNEETKELEHFEWDYKNSKKGNKFYTHLRYRRAEEE